MIIDDSDKDALLHFLMTVLHHGSHPGDFSASVLASYSDSELSLWSKERVESCFEI